MNNTIEQQDNEEATSVNAKCEVTAIFSRIRYAVTHPGAFHADDVCVWAYLQLLGLDVPLYRRVPTPEEIEDLTVLVFDIGGMHDVSKLVFDHHQRGGAGARWDSDVPYASFGLVFDWMRPANVLVADRFEERIVEPVDAADVQWGTIEGTRPTLSFSACISGFNPEGGVPVEERDAAWKQAVEFAKSVLTNEMAAAKAHVAARQVVIDAYTEADGKVLVLTSFVPWSTHVFDRKDQADLLYVVFPSERGGYCIQQIPTGPGKMDGRKPLPEAWAGQRGDVLAALVGLSYHGDATFCHPGRFIAGAEDYAGVMRLASAAIAEGGAA